MAYLARWPEWLHACVLWWMTTEALENCIHFPRLKCCDSSLFYCSFFSPPPHHCASSSHCFLAYIHLVLFSLFLFLSDCLFSFCFCPPRPFAVNASLWTSNYSQVIALWFHSEQRHSARALKQPFKLHPQPPSELPLCKMLFSNSSGATT